MLLCCSIIFEAISLQIGEVNIAQKQRILMISESASSQLWNEIIIESLFQDVKCEACIVWYIDNVFPLNDVLFTVSYLMLMFWTVTTSNASNMCCLAGTYCSTDQFLEGSGTPMLSMIEY